MEKSRRQSKTRKGSGTAGGAGGSNGAEPYSDEGLLKAINHPLRRQALRLLHSSELSVSPTRIEKLLELGGAVGDKLSSVSYHMTVLSGYNAIRCVGQRQVRGAMEHFYASNVADVAWLRGVLSRTQESDEAKLWPKGRPRRKRKSAERKDT
jgi:DNA-binding transcriptional ArsR family regulator